MMRFVLLIRNRRLALLVALALTVSSCQTWRHQRLPPTQNEPLPGNLRITRVDGERVHLTPAWEAGDSAIAGMNSDGEVVVVPWRVVSTVEAKEFDSGKTMMLVIFVGVPAVFGILCSLYCPPF